MKKYFLFTNTHVSFVWTKLVNGVCKLLLEAITSYSSTTEAAQPSQSSLFN